MIDPIGLRALELYLPATRVAVAELPEVAAFDPQQRHVFDQTTAGMATVAVDDEREGVDLAVAAARGALQTSALDPAEIGLLIYLENRAPAYLMSSEATRAQALLGLDRARAFCVGGVGCASIAVGLDVARMFIAAGGADNVLICAGSKPLGRRRYRDGLTVVGDAGLAAILSTAEQATSCGAIVDIAIETDGQYWDVCKVPYRFLSEDEIRDDYIDTRHRFTMAVASRNVFCSINQQLRDRHRIERVDHHIMPSLSLGAFDAAEAAQGVRFAASCREACRTLGHLGAIDTLLAYRWAADSGELAAGDTVLIENSSPAACWSSMLVRR